MDFHISSAEDDQNDMSDFIQCHANESGSPSNKTVLDKYLDEALEPLSDKFGIHAWWKVNEPRFSLCHKWHVTCLEYQFLLLL